MKFNRPSLRRDKFLDGPFIVNEVMQWCRMKKKQALIFKVDFEKAYDSVRWDFLDDVLDKFGFGSKWRAWIQSCLDRVEVPFLLMEVLRRNFSSLEVLSKVIRYLRSYLFL